MTTKLCVCGDPNCTTPYGICHCGVCGKKTTLNSKNDRHYSIAKGQPRKFVRGHANIHGRPTPEQPKDLSIRAVALTRGKIAFLDAEDYERLSIYRYVAARHKNSKHFYAERTEGRRTIGMHQDVLPNCPTVDHINESETLNNCKSNLRSATKRQQSYNQGISKNNTTGFKGVTKSNDKKRYYASIMVNGKARRLGTHDQSEDAARAYDAAAIDHFGEFAWLNFPEEHGRPRRVPSSETTALPRTSDDCPQEKTNPPSLSQHDEHPLESLELVLHEILLHHG